MARTPCRLTRSGAHYLPLPTREARAVRELLADLGALQGDPQAVAPHYDETMLCHAPQERLHIRGLWQEGLLPRLGVGQAERAQAARFQEMMAEFRAATDAQGRRAFALPVALSSPEPAGASSIASPCASGCSTMASTRRTCTGM